MLPGNNFFTPIQVKFKFTPLLNQSIMIISEDIFGIIKATQ